MATVSKTQLATALCGASALAVGWAALNRRRRALHATVTQLVVYPVKSCRGITLEKAELDAGGIMHDREWMIVRAPTAGSDDMSALMLTIRELPRMASIQPSFTSEGKLMLCTDDGKSIVVDNDKPGTEYSSKVWRTNVTGIDQGDAVSKFLSGFLGCLDEPVRLIRMEQANRRLADDSKYAPAAVDEDQGGYTRFSDWSQLSIISNQTLTWLNSKEPESGGLSNSRFRMNIVVDAAEAFAEDNWRTFSVGEVDFRFLKQCGRCTVPNADPATGTSSKNLEPLKTLKKLRRGEYPFLEKGAGVQAFLGTNVRHFYKPGQFLRVGDTVVVKERQGSWLPW